MKKLKDFENEIIKCSKCGLCQAVCPIFKLTGNECAVSKGKFVMLSGVLNGDLHLNDKILSYIDLCTKCEKCSKFCPAGINAVEVFQTAKYEYLKNKLSFKILQFVQIFLFSKKILNFIDKITHLNQEKNSSGEILYFKGCINKVLPKTELALKKLLKNAGMRIVEADFDCCGLPFYSSGNLERYEQAKNFNLDIIKKVSPKYILTDCASCESSLKKYVTSVPIVNAETLISDLKIDFKPHKKIKVAYHKPCHLENSEIIKNILLKDKNIEFVEIPETCCGLAGEFCLKNPKLSNKISTQRTKEILTSGADVVLTSCPLCEIGLKKGLWAKRKFNIKVMNILEFLTTCI